MFKFLKRAVVPALIFGATSCIGLAQWQDVATSPSFSQGAGHMLLLTDGRVIVQNFLRNDWKILTPDATGNYINGSWSSGGSMQTGYEPLYYASSVLPSGKILVIGGEYITSGGSAAQSSDGATYDPASNSWTQFTGPASYTGIGDSMASVLPDGKWMLHRRASSSSDYAIYDPLTGLWTEYDGPSHGKADKNSEEGWTLLPEGTILCVDCSNGNHAEKYDIAANQWISAGETQSPLASNGGLSIVPECGPHALMYDGKTFSYGASGNTGIYSMGVNKTDTGSWADGPTLTIGGKLMTAFDAPSAVMPDGRVLCMVSPIGFSTPSHAVIFDGTNLTAAAADPSGAAGRQSYEYRLLVLPNGQVMLTDSSNTVQIYTDGATVGSNSWRPVISSAPSRVIPGRNYTLTGKQLNGMTEGSYYGDDATNSTNYPIVRINKAGNVYYCRTHDHSTMAVATGNATVSTVFEVKSDAADGASTIEAVANGIPSFSQGITVERKKPITTAHLAGTLGTNNWYVSDVTVSFTYDVLVDSGVVVHHKIDGGGDSTSATIFVNTDSSDHVVEFWGENPLYGADGVEPHQFIHFKRDATKPTLSFNAQTPAQNGFGWNNTDVTITYTTSDATSGVFTALPPSPLVFTAEGFHQTKTVTVTDNAGNHQDFTTAFVNIDKTKPVTTDTEPDADGCNGWYHGAVTVTLHPTDNLSGVQVTKYIVDGGATQTYGSPFIVSGDFIHTVEYWSVDKADNVESHHTLTIKIDGTPPVVTGAPDKTTIWSPNHKLVKVIVSGKMTDGLSGIDPGTAKFWVDDEYNAVEPSGPITVGADGSYMFLIFLDASRLGKDKNGRLYTIFVEVMDLACNKTTIHMTVTVPHDQRKFGH